MVALTTAPQDADGGARDALFATDTPDSSAGRAAGGRCRFRHEEKVAAAYQRRQAPFNWRCTLNGRVGQVSGAARAESVQSQDLGALIVARLSRAAREKVMCSVTFCIGPGNSRGLSGARIGIRFAQGGGARGPCLEAP